jgi:integrase
MDRLRDHQAKQKLGNAVTGKPVSLLVFPNRHNRPRPDMLALCKTIGERAGLQRKDCWLHKFRSTNATNWLRAKDVATVAGRLGHTHQSTVTERYLAALKSEDQAGVAEALAR